MAKVVKSCKSAKQSKRQRICKLQDRSLDLEITNCKSCKVAKAAKVAKVAKAKVANVQNKAKDNA